VVLPPHVAVVHSAKVPLQTVKELAGEAVGVATAAGDAIADEFEELEAEFSLEQEKRNNEPARIATTAAFFMSISPSGEAVSISSDGMS